MSRQYNKHYDFCFLEALYETEKLGFRVIKNVLEKKLNKKLEQNHREQIDLKLGLVFSKLILSKESLGVCDIK